MALLFFSLRKTLSTSFWSCRELEDVASPPFDLKVLDFCYWATCEKQVWHSQFWLRKTLSTSLQTAWRRGIPTLWLEGSRSLILSCRVWFLLNSGLTFGVFIKKNVVNVILDLQRAWRRGIPTRRVLWLDSEFPSISDSLSSRVSFLSRVLCLISLRLGMPSFVFEPDFFCFFWSSRVFGQPDPKFDRPITIPGTEGRLVPSLVRIGAAVCACIANIQTDKQTDRKWLLYI